MPATLLEKNPHRGATEASISELRLFITHYRAALQDIRARGKADADRVMETTKFFNGDTMTEGIDDGTRVLCAFLPYAHSFFYSLPKLFNNSCIIQIYTLLEERGRDLCNTLNEKDKAIAVTFDDLKKKNHGSGFKALRKFLNSHCGIKYTHWRDLDYLRRIRNVLVHANGLVTDVSLLKDIKAKNGGASIDKTGHLALTHVFIDEALDRVAALFAQVYKEKNFGQSLYSGFVPDEISIISERVGGKLKAEVSDKPFDFGGGKESIPS
jgi:hypothetical protein